METEQEFTTVRSIVHHFLETDPRCRNSDKWLTILTLRELGFKIEVDYKQLSEMPSWETVRRCRQKLQEEFVNLRADEEVEEARKERQEVYKEEFGVTNNYTNRKGVIVESNFIRKAKGVEVFE